MEQILNKEPFDFVNEKNKEFIIAFDRKMKELGYESNGILPYVCWGKFVTAYKKAGVKSGKCVARFYYRDDCVLFRMYFSRIEDHRGYIENAPAFIREMFTNEIGNCGHCKNNCKDENGNCSHCKVYRINGVRYEKCDGQVFYTDHLDIDELDEYIGLIKEFYPVKKQRRK